MWFEVANNLNGVKSISQDFPGLIYASCMSILVVIPARSGSVGLPGKNFRIFHGVPLFMWAVNLAKKIPGSVEICVSTDSTEIESTVSQTGWTLLNRPPEISGSDATDQSVLLHALEFYASENKEFEMVLMLQPTAPGRNLNEIVQCIFQVRHNGHSACWTVVEVESKLNAYKQLKVHADGKFGLVIPQDRPLRRQELSQTFIRNGNCYAMKVETLMTDIHLLGSNPTFLLCVDEMINIDDIDDFYRAEAILQPLDGNLQFRRV